VSRIFAFAAFSGQIPTVQNNTITIRHLSRRAAFRAKVGTADESLFCNLTENTSLGQMQGDLALLHVKDVEQS